MNLSYNIKDKRKLAERIENVKDMKIIEQIKNIIFKENPNISVTKNSSGILLYFHNLTDKTYHKINKLFVKIENKQLNDLTKTFSDNNETTELDNNVQPIDNPNSRDKYRLSNKEKNIIRRKQYEKDIGETEDNELYISDDDKSTNNSVFVKKNEQKISVVPTNKSKKSVKTK